MKNLFDEIHEDHMVCKRLLDQLAEQLDKLHQGKFPDYYLMLDDLSKLEYFSEYVLSPKEDLVFAGSIENRGIDQLENTIEQFRLECCELIILTNKVHSYIDAALEGNIFEKDPFEHQLETYIQRQRDHITTEENVIFPLLRQNHKEYGYNNSV